MKLLLWVSVFACALAPAQDIKSGYVRGKAVHYKVVDGVAVTEGDILIDPESSKTPVKEAIGISTDRLRWPDGIVPYSIDVAIPDQQRITGAVQHWNDNTRLRLIPRTDQADYVRFVQAFRVFFLRRDYWRSAVDQSWRRLFPWQHHS